MKRFKMDQVEVLAFVLTLLRAVNNVQSLDICFDASLEGMHIWIFCLCVLSAVLSFTTGLELFSSMYMRVLTFS